MGKLKAFKENETLLHCGWCKTYFIVENGEGEIKESHSCGSGVVSNGYSVACPDCGKSLDYRVRYNDMYLPSGKTKEQEDVKC